MGRWVSIYLNDMEFQRFEKIRKKIEEREGKTISPYELVKRWVLEKLEERED